MTGEEESPRYIETIPNECQGKILLNAGCLPETEMDGEVSNSDVCHLPFALLYFFD